MKETVPVASALGTVALEWDPESGDVFSCLPAPGQLPEEPPTLPSDLREALLEGTPLGDRYTLCQEAPAWAPHFWEVLRAVPRGETVTYGELCRRCGLPPGYARAVGRLLGRNRLALLLPCHRVVRSDGTPGGYRWGVALKRRLLDRERSQG